MKTTKILFALLFFQMLQSCKHGERFYVQFFIENQTSETILFKAYLGNRLRTELKLRPKKRRFLDGFMLNSEVIGPNGVSTIRADSIVIELKNGKKVIDVCRFSQERFPSSHCKGERSFFNGLSYKRVNDEGKITYNNRIYEFSEDDAKNAK